MHAGPGGRPRPPTQSPTPFPLFHKGPPAMTESSANALQRGLANRRRVLGDEWVDQSVARANELNVEFQRMITAYAWDGIWSRPGLERRTRRIMVLAITASKIGREHV